MNIINFYEFLKENFMPLLISIGIIVLMFFFLVPICRGIRPVDHWMYIVNGDENYSLNRVRKDHLQFMLGSMESYEELSYECLMDLWDKMEEMQLETVQEGTGDLSKLQKIYMEISEITNLDYAIIRMLMELDNIYCDLLDSYKGKMNKEEILKKSKQIDVLKDFYTAYYYYLQYKTKGDLGGEEPEVKLKSAYMLFKKIYKNIELFPEELRENLEIETLQFLTYCSFVLNRNNDISVRELDKWNSYAQKVRMEENDLRGTVYRRKYYWVDLSVLFNNLSSSRDLKKERNADNAFNALVRDIYDIKFLKSKFKQYECKVPEVKKYIYRLDTSDSEKDEQAIEQDLTGIGPWWDGYQEDSSKTIDDLMHAYEIMKEINRN